MPPLILILDDEPKIAALLQRSLARDGYEVECTADPLGALECLKAKPVDVLVTDLRMPGMDGLEVLRRAKAIRPDCEVIMMTAYATVETAREALKRGAIDYLTKPFSADDDLKPLLNRIFEAEADEAPSAADRSAPPPLPGPVSPVVWPAQTPPADDTEAVLRRFVTRNAAMRKSLERVPRIAASSASVLLRGESGTGKEVLANIIHDLSPRRAGPMVRVNCGALPENLLESELFGHAKGSFTGAVAERAGLFEAADGGTIFLDEIGEVSPALQVKLLRVLQEGEFQRVGESRTRRADVRVLAATNRNLEDMMKDGRFRQDLFYRLNVVPIVLPPLRERREDVWPLVEFFCGRIAPRRNVAFSPEARRAIEEYDWPGNTRELENAVEHALVLGDPAAIQLEDLPVSLQDFRAKQAAAASPEAVGHATLEDIEQRCLMAALHKTRFNRTRAAHLLGITRRTLGYRIRKYGLEDEIARMQSEPDANSTS